MVQSTDHKLFWRVPFGEMKETFSIVGKFAKGFWQCRILPKVSTRALQLQPTKEAVEKI